MDFVYPSSMKPNSLSLTGKAQELHFSVDGVEEVGKTQ